MNRYALFILVVLSAATALVGCGRSGQPAKEAEKKQIKTYQVVSAEVLTYVEATGSVQPDLAGTSKLTSPLPGAVGQIFAKVGDRVKKGDPLLVIKSPEATDTYAGYLAAFTQAKQAERIYNLNKELFQIGAVTKNELLNSESSYHQFSALKDGFRKKLHLYGCPVDDDGASSKLNCADTVTVRAPMNGYIADIVVHVGDRVDTSAPLLVIADPQNIVIVANIYDTDIPKIKKGSSVRFSTDTFPDQVFPGIITYVSDISDTESKTVKTFIKLQERKDLFKQNMFLKIKIEDRKMMLPVIPQSAMVYKEGSFYVYVPGKNGSPYELKGVHPVKEVPEKSMAVEGVKEGDTVVVSAIELEKP